jgi:hypothetical protein
MDKYYKILGVDELTSKSLLKIAYATAIKYARENQISISKMLDIHVAYRVLLKYRLKFKVWTKNGKIAEHDQSFQETIENSENQIKNGRIDTFLPASKIILETGYFVRTLIFGIFPVVLFILSEMFFDFTRFTRDARDFFASLIFYFIVLNLFFSWIDTVYSLPLIVVAFALVFWRLRSFERKVIQAIMEHLDGIN